MQVSSKIIAIALVVILGGVAVGSAAYFTMSKDRGSGDANDGGANDGDTNDGVVGLISGGLEVYGNANGDYAINSDDADIISKIISGELKQKDYPGADANRDGVIDSKDLEIVNKIIAGEDTVIHHLNHHNINGPYVVTTKWPIRVAVATGAANSLMMLKMTGTEEFIVGTSYTNSSPPNNVLFPYFKTLPRLGDSATRMDLETTSNLVTSKGCTALITADNRSYIKNEQEFENIGVDVIRIPSSAVDTEKFCSAVVMTGFLFNKPLQGQMLSIWYKNLMNEINGKLPAEADRISAVASSSKGSVSTKHSDYTDVVIAAGATFPLTDLSTESSSVKLGDGIYNYDIDYIIRIKTGKWYEGGVNKVTMYKEVEDFALTKAYQDGHAYVISGEMPIPCRVAYTAEIFYPEKFAAGFGDAKHQEFANIFFGTPMDLTGLYFTLSKDQATAS